MRTTELAGIKIPLPVSSSLILQWLGILAIVAIVIVIVVLIKRMKKYDVLAEVHSKVAGSSNPGEPGELVEFTPAAYVYDKKTATWYLHLKNYNQKIPPPPYACRKILDHKRFKEIVYLWQEDPDNFVPFVPETDYKEKKLKLNMMDSEATWLAAKAADEIKETYSRESWFEKYGIYLLWAATIVGVIILLYIVVEKFSVLENVAKSLENAARYLSK